ncbi:cycloisomaltooligosaccharide glucanotransferase [Pelobium manganitolerans]|uniref:Cycloisomaltooligosaccharide glucanotransferase n=1 Tax=Pelobium manganitolerans TaxID=1842495 RepID=A0A419S9F4_9SPHI|nr:glycoside hydrolase family 66 protein [Pelobium manganitolerans]RKD18609.1 cycloisomaltooligosaccharide glucanotransferase [Pelobium manganitolerans]
MKKIYIPATLCLLVLFGCKKDYFNVSNNPITYGQSYIDITLSTDKSIYKPGEPVKFNFKELVSGAKVRYSYLGKVIKEDNLIATTWTWNPPADDYRGYMVEIFTTENGAEKVVDNIAVDVSSDWAKFPRYGFLSDYGKIQDVHLKRNIELLNRYHINGLQFYDWLYDHHRPLAGTVENPATSWPDIFGRTNYFSTVKGYIDEAKTRNMKTMFYNLCYGALNSATADGVKEEWYIFNDKNHQEKDYHPLSGRSNIYLVNAGNTDWQQYINGRNKDVYDAFGFDGYHIDQLGYRGDRYDYNGNLIDMPTSYSSFINAMKAAQPDKYLLFNAVGGYAQDKIAPAPVDFLYTEVWGGREGDNESMSYADLINVMNDNLSKSNYQKNIVLAAYMDYNVNSSGYVNKPGILLADAAIFAWGGAHLELGEHYLINEYFPKNNLQMRADLGKALISYYDFSVAYQNLLRDGGDFQPANVSFANSAIVSESWPAAKGKVATIGKKVNGKDIVHLINFTNATTMVWRDNKATQAEPELISTPTINVRVSGTPSKVWFASPDVDGGVAKILDFTQTGNKVTLTLPSLKYWDMVVIEY